MLDLFYYHNGKFSTGLPGVENARCSCDHIKLTSGFYKVGVHLGFDV